MAMNRAQFARELQEGLNAVFGLEYKRHPDLWRALFEIENSRKAYEEDVLVSGFGAAPVKNEGAGVAYDSAQEVWASRYVHETIALAFAITEEAEEDNLYMTLGRKYSRALARSMKYTKELKGAGIFNNGFTDTAIYHGGDGKPLLSTSHPLAGGGTWQNKLTTPADLHESSLEDICIGVSNLVDERGIPIVVNLKCLAVPTALQFTAHRIMSSPYRPGTADNDVNAMKDMGKWPQGVKVNRFFTDASAYFGITDCPDGLKHMPRTQMKRTVEGEFESGNMRYRARERYSFGWTDPRSCYASEGAS